MSTTLGLWQVEDALLALLRATIDPELVHDGPPAQSRMLKGAVWPHEIRDDIEWRGLGAQPWNRTESIRVALRSGMYRESNQKHEAARAAAKKALRPFVEQVQAAIATDPTLGGVCTDVLLSQAKVRLVEGTKGWEAQADLLIDARYIPTPGTP